MKSIQVILLISLVWIILGAVYYPKWNKLWSEATISWDVSGYYHYLPGLVIYHDLRQQKWMDAINEKYLPSPAYDQAFLHNDSGNKVNKYAIGQAVLFAPFFLAGHTYSKITGSYPADGYSKPYQFSIWLGSLLFSILGLILLRKILLHYFDDEIVALTLIALGVGTNWLEYASISNGMNHTWLFTLICVLVLSVIRFYKNADWTSVVGMGASLGLAVLTRPTEIIWILIPLLWGITTLNSRISFLTTHWRKCLVAIIISGFIILIQPVYWKYVSGEWIINSYGTQEFNWFHPKIWRGLMGVNIGWWLYTPLMLLAMFGWYGLYKKQRNIFWPIFITSMLAIYLTLSWPYFEGSGGLGQRNLIQIYPLMAFPLATMITWFNKNSLRKRIWILLIALNVYYTGWWVHQAHKGGFFQPGQMTTPYFYNVVGRLHPDRDYFKLLDNREYFKGNPSGVKVILTQDFEQDSVSGWTIWPEGGKAVVFDEAHQFFGPVDLSLTADCKDWLRLEADFIIRTREWDVWKYAQWIVHFYQGDKAIKTNIIRVHRLIPADHTSTHVFFDVKIPDQSFDQCTMTLWNADSPQTLLMDNLKVSCFK